MAALSLRVVLENEDVSFHLLSFLQEEQLTNWVVLDQKRRGVKSEGRVSSLAARRRVGSLPKRQHSPAKWRKLLRNTMIMVPHLL